MFSFRLVISLDICISCQEIGKEMLSEDGLLSLKILSEQSTISQKNKLEIFCCFEEAKFVTVFGKNTKAQGHFLR